VELRRNLLSWHQNARRSFNTLLMCLLLISSLALAAQPVQSSPQIAPNQPDDVSLGVFVLTGSMQDRRENHTVTLLQNGEVLVAGGISDTGRS
jgi:hypothetical protein